MTELRPRLLVVAGPTASGKSALAVSLARAFGGEVVNADSQQVFRGLDVGTGKPTEAEREGIPHHLFDLVEPWDQLDAARFASLADEAIAGIAARGRVPVVTGGTGLWLRALLKGLVDAPRKDPVVRARLEQELASEGLASLHARLAEVDPEAAVRIHATDPVRIVRALEVFEVCGTPLSVLQAAHAKGGPRYGALQLALAWPKERLEARIRSRCERMFREGLVEETRRVAGADGRARGRLSRIMGYREALEFIEGKVGFDEAVERAYREHRRYAKRQGTWFRAEPEWQWIDGEDPSAAFPKAAAFLDRAAAPPELLA